MPNDAIRFSRAKYAVRNRVFIPCRANGRSSTHCARTAQPPEHNVQNEYFVLTGPRESFGINPQFCDQTEVSSSNFQGSGDSKSPSAEPPVNFSISLRVSFIKNLFMTLNAAVPASPFGMAMNTPIHIHSFPRMHTKTRNIQSPYISAVSGNPIYGISSERIGRSDPAMTILAFHFTDNHMEAWEKYALSG